jgi:hypothetical protein
MPKASQSRRRKQNQDRSTEQEQPTTSASAATEMRPRRRIKELSNRTRIISLAFGDILCFLIFVSLGSNEHGKGINFLYSLWLAVPFVAAWFLVSPFVGAYRADVATLPSKMLVRTILAWLATWPVAMLFRWLLVERLSPVSIGSFLSFSTVVLIVNTILLALWRWPFTLNNSLRKRGV